MSKPKHARALADHEAQAILSNVRTSPRKLNLVAAMIRNLPAQRAIATLTFSKRRIAHQVRKTLESAIANAENNHQLDVDRLVVTRAEVGRSIVMRRFHARGRGRSAQIEKWFSHMKIVVAEKQEAVDDGVIEGSAIPARGRQRSRGGQTTAEIAPVLPVTAEPVATDHAPALPAAAEPVTTDHAHTEAGLALPSTVDDEGEAAEQSLSAEAVAEQTPADEPETPPDHSGQGAT